MTTTIAERFLQLRGKTKQGEFAKILGINPNTLRNYENGRVLPNQEILERICVTFSVSPSWILLGQGPMRSDAEQAQQPSAQTPDTPQLGCTECVALRLELAKEREERRELSAENRLLWRENGELKEKVARLEERAGRDISPSGLTDVPTARTA